MKLIEKRMLRGPNLHSRQPCIKAIIDLEELDGVSSADISGFTEQLCARLPSLQNHRCSVGTPGGFIQRLQRGTYMAHVVEHVMLELQCLAGSDVGFGRARAVKGMPGCYRVICAYRIEPLIGPVLNAAMAFVSALARGESPSLDEVVETLRLLVARHGTGPSTRAILTAAARRGIPATRLTDEASLYQLGYGVRQKRIQATVTGQTSHIATAIACDKQLTRTLLEQAGIPVPLGVVVRDAASAVHEAARLGGPVVIKPADSNHGKGVRTSLTDPGDIADAFEQARRYSSRVIVEEFIEGHDYRVLVVNGKMVAAAQRKPPHVSGDGTSSIRELIATMNDSPERGEGHGKALTRIAVDLHTAAHLQRLGMGLETIPEFGQDIVLRENANLSTGGTAQDVTDRIHPATAHACERAVRQIGLDVAGVDLLCHDIAVPLSEQGAIVEINAAPGLRMHEMPSLGVPRGAGAAIVASLFAEGDDGRIPVVAITGTNGKTTTTLLIASAFMAAGRTTGVTTTEGVFINGDCVSTGDCTGYRSARTVLGSPDVEVAVLETARGGILKRGLGFDHCDVAVVLNVTADHLGLDGVHTVREMALVKSVVAKTARQAVVLNANDPHCVAIAPQLRRGVEVLYFSCTADSRVLHSHLARGGRGVTLHEGKVVLDGPEGRRTLFDIASLAVTLEGRAMHNVANTLAAVAALVAQGDCSFDAIEQGIRSFRCTAQINPLRLNVTQMEGVTVLHDYAHNAAAYRAILDTAHAMGCRRIVGVITAPGDRRDTELRQIARLCAADLDEIVVYEIDQFRGRRAGDVLRVLKEGALAGAPAHVAVHAVMGAQKAICTAFQLCFPGDLLLIGGATRLDDLDGLMALGSSRTLTSTESKTA